MRIYFRALMVNVFILFSACNFFAQTTEKTLDGFWGMKFGSSIAECKRIILSKEGAVLDTKHSTENKLIVDGAEFGGRKTAFIALLFTDNKLHTAKVYFVPRLESKVFELYDEIKSEINDKYYVTKNDYRLFKYPYEDGDGYETQAIKLGKASIASFWSFPRSDGHKNSISLEINETLIVILSYQDGLLIEEAIEKQKSKT